MICDVPSTLCDIVFHHTLQPCAPRAASDQGFECRDAASPVVWGRHSQPITPACHDCPHRQQAADTSKCITIFTLKPLETPPHPHPCCLGGVGAVSGSSPQVQCFLWRDEDQLLYDARPPETAGPATTHSLQLAGRPLKKHGAQCHRGHEVSPATQVLP